MNFEQYLSESYLTEGEVFDLFKKIKERINSLSDKEKEGIVKTTKEYIKNNFRKVVSMIKNFFKDKDPKKYGFSIDKLEALKESLYLSEFELHGGAAGGGVILGIAVILIAIFVNLGFEKYDNIQWEKKHATITNKIDRAVDTLKHDPSKLFNQLHDEAKESRFPEKAKTKTEIKAIPDGKGGFKYIPTTSREYPEDMERAK